MADMTAETDLLPLPEWQGDFMTESEFREEAQAYARACVSSATEALRDENAALRDELDNKWAEGVHSCGDHCQRTSCVLRRQNKRLAEALRDLLRDTQHKDHDCGDAEWCPVIKARALLREQEEGK